MAKKALTAGKNVSGRKGRGKIWVMAVDPFAGFDIQPSLRFAAHRKSEWRDLARRLYFGASRDELEW